MKIALFYRLWFSSGEKFLAAAKKTGVDLVPVQYDELTLRQDNTKFEILFQDRPLSDFDLFYFRAVGGATEWAYLLLDYARKHKIPVVDEYLQAWGPYRRAKSFSGIIFQKNGVNYPRTSFVSGEKELLKEVRDYRFPFILKVSTGGRHGVGTFMIDKQSTLEKAIKGRLKRSSFLLQEYIPNDGDYRLMTVGYQVLGGFKRRQKEAGLLLNRSVGPSEVLKKIPDQVKNEAEKAVKVLKVEIASIDMVIDERDQRPVIIEVNEAPEFRVFGKRTGIDVGLATVEYLKNKACH